MNSVCYTDVPVGTILGRLDAKESRTNAEAPRYMVVLTTVDGAEEKRLMRIDQFRVMSAAHAWKKVPFEVLEATLTIKDPLVVTE
jgi:hypothetical protein